MTKTNIITIKCPSCGTEYLPEEVFTPKGFFGKPEDIERTYDGRISTFSGKSLDTHETYKCDVCNCTFNVDVIVKFNTSIDVKKDFAKEYVTKLFPSRVTLFEGP